MKRAPYLLYRSGRPYFRIRIPKELQESYGGRTEIKEALRLADPALAKAEAMRRGADVSAEFIRRRAALKAPRPALDLNRLLELIHANALAADEEGRIEQMPNAPSEDAPARRKALGKALATGNFSGTNVADILADYGIEVPSPAEVYKAGATFARILDARFARDRGEVVETPPQPSLEGAQGRSLRDVHTAWLERRQPAPKTQHEALRELNGFLGGEGKDRHLSKITRVDIVAYKDKILEEGKKPATAKKRLSFIRGLLSFAVAEGWLDADPSAGIRIVAPKKNGKEDRRPFTKAEMQAILASPISKAPEDRFLPLLAALTGARRGELAQLRRADIDTESLILTVTDEDDDQRVKTAGSRRSVPIHPAIVAAGFIDYVKALDEDEEWIFPALTSDRFGLRGDAWGKRFGRHLRGPLQITDKRAVFHSFRHTLKRALRDLGCPKEIHDAITGHEGEDVGSTYGKGVSVETMREWVLKVDLKGLGVG